MYWAEVICTLATRSDIATRYLNARLILRNIPRTCPPTKADKARRPGAAHSTKGWPFCHHSVIHNTVLLWPRATI